MIAYKQLSLGEIFSDCSNSFENDKYRFLSLLEKNLDIDEFISISFRNHFYASFGRHRKYPLHAFLWALLLQRIFSIPTDSLLIIFLKYSKELRDFCGFSKVPDAPKFTRFKQDFLSDLQSFFDNLVDVTEPICQALDTPIHSNPKATYCINVVHKYRFYFGFNSCTLFLLLLNLCHKLNYKNLKKS